MSVGLEGSSAWHVLPQHVVAQVVVGKTSVACSMRGVCKAWREQAMASVVTSDITLASPAAQSSLAAWLQHCGQLQTPVPHGMRNKDFAALFAHQQLLGSLLMVTC